MLDRPVLTADSGAFGATLAIMKYSAPSIDAELNLRQLERVDRK